MDEFYKIVAYILGGLVGLCVGSFLNVVIYRVPAGMRLDKPDSHCPKCKYKLRWYDNIPILSYIMLGGKCRSCKQKIPFRYTVVEILNMLAWLVSVWMFWDSSIVFTVVHALASSVLICVAFIDLEHMLVFDRFVLILAALGVVATFFDPHYGWLSHLVGGVIGFAFFYGIHALFYYGLKKDALGGGDIKLSAAVGLLLGWQRLLLGVLLASVSASVVLLIWAKKREQVQDKETKNTQECGEQVCDQSQNTVLTQEDEDNQTQEVDPAEYPFAPFLCAGFFLALSFGTQIIQAYLSLLGL